MADATCSPPSFEPPEEEPAWLGLRLDRVGLVLGPLLLVGWLLFVERGSLTPDAHRLAGILLLTLTWWLTEPIPIPATGLLAVALCVILDAVPAGSGGRLDAARTALAPFGDRSVFFLLGGL